MLDSNAARLRLVIVDDERPAREELRRMLLDWPDVDVVGEAATLEEAKEVIESTQPDVILLDIQLQHQSAFELIEQLEVSGSVIFVTAYAKYAVRAFEVSALDYLLKPVEPQRLREAIDRVQSESAASFDDASVSPDDVLIVKDSRRYHFIRVDQIRYIKADGEYSEVVAMGVSGLSGRSLAHWERALPPDRFIRIHRSTIANLHFVSMMTPTDGSSFILTLKDSHEALTVSRRYAAKIRLRLT
ncbi:MAG: LytTR family DNA-binding domain-containing protein [Myxococcota bacterium]